MNSTSTIAPARTALVTGASRGIGRAIAEGLAEAGLDVGLVARDESKLEAVADGVRSHGRTAVVVSADVTAPDAVASAVKAVADGLGSIDLLVNNAGRIDREVPIWEADPEEWWQIVETNVRGPFLFAHAVVPGMLERGGGRVINLNSGSGTKDSPVATAYYTSKTALFRVGGALHEGGFDQGLRTFELAPGVVVTDMTRSMEAHRDRTEWTDVSNVVDLAIAMARGELDTFSGRYIRAGADTPASLRALAGNPEAFNDHIRRLRVANWPEQP